MSRPIKTIVSMCLVPVVLTGCLSFGSGTTTTSTTLGADDPTTTTTTTSTLSTRLKSGIPWLWATYTRLKDAGDLPGLSDLKADIVDVEQAFGQGNLASALDLWNRAWNRGVAIAATLKKS